MTKVLGEILGINPPKEYKVKPNGVVGIDPTLLYGVELEIENLERDEGVRAKRAVAGMQYHKDGSLRNNGGEFVTSPMNFSALTDTLNRFFAAGGYNEVHYSERCSVHVHANCCDLTIEQVRQLLCLYQTLEKVLFNYVDGERDKNIFCVPLGESIIATKMLTSDDSLLAHGHSRWRKYTALNVLPLWTQGTIEFRHMPGTHDLDKILQWCEIIGCLFKYAREHEFKDVVKTLMELNTSSAYATFMQGIFPRHIYDVLAVGPYREFLEEGVINMKVMLATPTVVAKATQVPNIPGNPWIVFNDAPQEDRQVNRALQGGVNQIWRDVIAARVDNGRIGAIPQPVEAPRFFTARETERIRQHDEIRRATGREPLTYEQNMDWLRRNPDPVNRRRPIQAAQDIPEQPF
jgi:hypothetical protein